MTGKLQTAIFYRLYLLLSGDNFEFSNFTVCFCQLCMGRSSVTGHADLIVVAFLKATYKSIYSLFKWSSEKLRTFFRGRISTDIFFHIP